MDVVITGMGIVSPLGCDAELVFERLLKGLNAVYPLKKLDPELLPVKFAAEVIDFDPLKYMPDAKKNRQAAQYIRYGFAAARMAYEQAGLDQIKDKDRIAVIAGSGMGGIEVFEQNVLKFKEAGADRISPFFIPMAITNMLAGTIAIEFGLTGPNFSISTACATGNHCLIEAAHMITRGEADCVLAGGSEAAITYSGMSGFAASRALSNRNDDPKTASRPYDLGRNGFVVGEGAGILVLENGVKARARGAKILARYLGGGISSDAHHITAPEPSGRGATLAIQKALNHARINPEQIGYVNAHGTSTQLGDLAEILALKTVFGSHAKNLKISSTKSMIGHSLGAASAMEAIVLVQSLRHKKIHPTINIFEQDPQCDLFVTPNQALENHFEYGISNSFGFGGHNSCIVLGVA